MTRVAQVVLSCDPKKVSQFVRLRFANHNGPTVAARTNQPQGRTAMALSLSEAAQHVGHVKSSVLRAIKNGRISGVRDDAGNQQSEPVELFRAFEPVAAPPLQPKEFEIW